MAEADGAGAAKGAAKGVPTDQDSGSRSPGPITPGYERPTAKPGYERPTAQLVDKRSTDTSRPIFSKRAMIETFSADVGDATYVYTRDDAGCAHIRRCTTSVAELAVPAALDGHVVSAIDHSAFVGLAHTEAIVVPDTVTALGWNAFANCPNLRRLVLPKHLAKLDKTWLAGSTQIEEVVLPDDVEVVDADFLKSCKPRRLVIGRTTHTVEVPALWADVVEHVSVSEDNPHLSTDGVSLFTRDGSTLKKALVGCEHYEVPAGCRAIGEYAFEGNGRIRTIALPDSLEAIGTGAFQESALVELMLPESVRTIGAHAFRRCTQLSAVRLGGGLEQIGARAFSGCSSLRHLVIPKGVRDIGKGAIAGLSTEVFIDAENPYLALDEMGLLYARSSPDGPWTLADACDPRQAAFTVRAGTYAIGPFAFVDHAALAQITLPDGLRVIGEGAFSGCPSLRSIELPDTVEQLAERAFFCTPLERIRIPASCVSIGSCALAYDPLQSGTGQLAAAASDMPFAYAGLRPANDSMTAEAAAAVHGSDNAVADVQLQIRSRLTATPMGGAISGAGPAAARSVPLRADVDDCNPRFFVEGGLLCERAEDGIHVLLYTGPQAAVTIPAQVTVIEPYAFAGARSVAYLVIHEHVRSLGTGCMSMAEPPAAIRIELDEAVEGRTAIEAMLLPGREGVRTLRSAFSSGLVDAAGLLRVADHAAVSTRDAFGALRYALIRLADPYLLPADMHSALERIAQRDPVGACLMIAQREWADGFELLADRGALTADNVDSALAKMHAAGLVSMTVQLIALKRRRFAAQDDYSL